MSFPVKECTECGETNHFRRNACVKCGASLQVGRPHWHKVQHMTIVSVSVAVVVDRVVQPTKLGLMLVMVDHVVQPVKLGLMSAVVDHVVLPVKLDVVLVVVDHVVPPVKLDVMLVVVHYYGNHRKSKHK